MSVRKSVDSGLTRRTFLGGAAILATLPILATACASPETGAGASSAQPTLIRMSPVALPGYIPMMVMEQMPELFESLNVKFEMSWFTNGVDATNSVLSGQSDACVCAALPLTTFLDKGSDVILPTVFVDSDNQRIIAKKSIASAADLAGKRIGVPQNSSGQYALMRYLEANGVDATSVTLVFSDPAELPTLLARDAADAIVWVEPIARRALELAGADKVHYLENPKMGSVFRDIAPLQVGRHYFDKYGDEGMLTLLQVFDLANKWIVENPADAAALCESQLKLDAGDGKWLMDDSQSEWPIYWDDAAVDNVTRVSEWAVEQGIISEVPDWSAHIDPTWLRQVRPDSVNLVAHDY